MVDQLRPCSGQVVQAHLIYATWNLIRHKNFEHDMTWMHIGLAIRTAMHINLHRVVHLPQAREGLLFWILRGVVRTWLMAYVIDCTLSAQPDKSVIICGDGSVRACFAILKPSDSEPLHRDDLLVASLAGWTQIQTRAMDGFRSVSDLHLTAISAPGLVQVFHSQFRQWLGRTAVATRRCAGENGEDMGIMLGMFHPYNNYARLVVQSFRARACAVVSDPLIARRVRGGKLSGYKWPTGQQYQIATVRLLESFGTDLPAPNVARAASTSYSQP